MASTNNISLIVVVSGQPTALKVNLHQTIDHLVHEALTRSGNQGQPSSEWELRKADGALVEQALTVEASGLVDGMTLYLSPRAGAGGALR
ncbi:MAG: DUF2604 domain-containing protein [Gemmatimonadaceae bacterium]